MNAVVAPRLVYVVTDSVSTALLRQQLRAMRLRGFDVTVISSPGERLEQCAREEGVRAVPMPMARPIRPWQDLKSLIGLFLALRSLRPHVVNAGTPKAALLGMIASWILRVPVRIYVLRGLHLETVRGPLRWVLALMERMTSFCATHIRYVSRSLREIYEEMELGPRRKGVLLLEGSSRGVEVGRFARSLERVDAARALRARLGIPQDARVAGVVGRLTRDKGVEDLVNAFLQMESSLQDLHLLLVGLLEKDDCPSPEILEQMQSLPRIHVTGALDDVAPAYHAMDFLVLPSYREGFPNVPLEAAAAGIPTIGYRSTGVRDAIVDGVTGALVERGDVEALAKAIARYASDPELCEKHGKAALERVRSPAPRFPGTPNCGMMAAERRTDGKAEVRKERGRFSSKRKADAALRLLRGEALDELSRELGVTAATFSRWRDEFLAAGQAGLKSRERTAADDEVLRLKALVGDLTMRLELARERARALEAESPFPWRKSRD